MENQYKDLLENFDKILSETIFLQEGQTKSNKGIELAKSRVRDYMQKMAGDNTSDFKDTANRLGFNSTGFGKDYKKYTSEYDKGLEDKLSGVLRTEYNPQLKQATVTPSVTINDDILRAAETLKKYIRQNPMGATIDWEGINNDPNRDWLLSMKDFIDSKGLSRLYDDNAPLPSYSSYGIKKDGNTNFDYMGVDDAALNKFKGDLIKFWTSRANNYAEIKYGMKITTPGFSTGNIKLGPQTLIINFTSALRCPAWNECLVKHACYARAGEKAHFNVYSANANKQLMWELTKNSPEMLELMLNMVKTHAFNYEKIYTQASGYLRGMKIKSLGELLNMDLTAVASDETLKPIFLQNKNVTNIRLNEDGDFIGQWLVDAFDDFAGKVKPFEINISAYTCRNLNFNNLSNIIINSSNIAVKGADRYFVAISEDAYNAFDNTFGGFDPNTERIKTVLKPLGTTDESGTWVPNGKLYYKCPCGIEEIMGPKKKNKSLKDYDCYKCNTCYNPNTFDNKQPYYIFVKVHGASAKELKERNGGNFPFGVSEHYKENIAAIEAQKAETKGKGKNKGGMLEEIFNYVDPFADTSDLALQQVTQNAIMSMNNHFSSYNALEEEKKVKDGFNNILDRINNTEF